MLIAEGKESAISEAAQAGFVAPTLAVLTSVHGTRDGDRLVLDVKAMEGMHLYARHWPGPVCWLLSFRDTPPSYSAPYVPETLPFEIIEVAEDRSDVVAKLPADALILASADNYLDFDLAGAMPGRVAYVIEYTLRTRLDILRAEDISLVRKARRLLWALTTERRRRRAIKAAIGLQSNGLPAHRLYGPIARRPMHYFDTRLTRAQEIDESGMQAKQARILGGEPIHLAFSGRLDRMKGVQFLVPLMQRLKAAELDFVFEIFGAGPLSTELAAAASGDLADRLIVHGPVPFAEALVPAMKTRIDLFICPHPQGDPSCTYMETLGCGVPIAGFANEAWAAMAEGQPFGAVVPVGDVKALADIVAALSRDRQRLASMAAAAAAFSREQPFETVFERRVDHLKTCAESLQRGAAVVVAAAGP